MKNISRVLLTILAVYCFFVPGVSVALVVNDHELDLSSASPFDEAHVSISGPEKYYKKFTLKPGHTLVKFNDLKIAKDGTYTYEALYLKHSKLSDTVTDPSSGRENAVRSITTSKRASGFFNVVSGKFFFDRENIKEPKFIKKPILKEEKK